MELNPTSYVILGMLGLEPMCGYEIKQLVDRSTRFFWAASYGQIYPELRRLSEAGLIDAARPTRGTARRRTEFELTAAGRRTLERWLARPAAGPGDARREPAEDLLLRAGGAGCRDRRRSRRSATTTAQSAAELRAIEATSTVATRSMRPARRPRCASGSRSTSSSLTGARGKRGEQRRMIDRLARLADRRGKRVVVIAAIFFALAGVLGAGVADRLDPYGADDPATESVIADQQLEDAGYRATEVIVLSTASTSGDAGRRPASRGGSPASSTPTATSPRSPATLETRSQRVRLPRRRRDLPRGRARVDRRRREPGRRRADRRRARAASRASASAARALAQKQVNEQVESDLRTAELLAFPILFLLSLLFFRSLVAALLPLLVGGLAIVGTIADAARRQPRSARSRSSRSTSSPASGSGSRSTTACSWSRATARRSPAPGPGSRRCGGRWRPPGRTVLFSSLTVAGALASLLVFPQRFLYSMGIGGALVALIAAAIALLVLPAVLALLGERVNSLSPAFLHRRAERRRAPGHRGLLVPALAARDALPGPDRDRRARRS